MGSYIPACKTRAQTSMTAASTTLALKHPPSVFPLLCRHFLPSYGRGSSPIRVGKMGEKGAGYPAAVPMNTGLVRPSRLLMRICRWLTTCWKRKSDRKHSKCEPEGASAITGRSGPEASRLCRARPALVSRLLRQTGRTRIGYGRHPFIQAAWACIQEGIW